MELPRHYYEDCFSDLEPYLLAHEHQVLHYRKGELFFSDLHFSINDKFYYYIQSGLAFAHGTTDNGDKKIICFYGKGSLSVADTLPYYYQTYLAVYMEALTDVTILLYNYETMMRMLTNSFALCMRVINFDSEMIAMLTYQVATLPMLSAECRLCDFLYQCYLYPVKLIQDEPRVLHVSQTQLAQYVGVTRIQIGRIVRELRMQGILATGRGLIRLLDVERLREKCSSSLRADS